MASYKQQASAICIYVMTVISIVCGKFKQKGKRVVILGFVGKVSVLKVECN